MMMEVINIMSLPIKVAQDMRKTLVFVCRVDDNAVFISDNHYAVILTDREYRDFAVKWAGYRGNALPPLELQENDQYKWYATGETWEKTEVGLDHMLSVSEEALNVTPSSFIREIGGTKKGKREYQRVVRIEDGRIEVVSDDWFKLGELTNASKIVFENNSMYKFLNTEGIVVMVLMGIRQEGVQVVKEELQTLLEEPKKEEEEVA